MQTQPRQSPAPKSSQPDPAVSVINEESLRAWRAAGRRQRTKSLLLTLAIAALVLLVIKVAGAGPLPQESEPGGGHRHAHRFNPENQLARLSERLQLTDEQKSKIKPLLDDQFKQLQSLREDSSVSREDKQSKFREIHARTSDQIRSLLTDQQKTKFDEMQKERQQRMKHWRQKGGAESGPPAN